MNSAQEFSEHVDWIVCLFPHHAVSRMKLMKHVKGNEKAQTDNNNSKSVLQDSDSSVNMIFTLLLTF